MMEVSAPENVCPSCGSDHLGPKPCGLTFRQRLLSVQVDTARMDTSEKHNYFDREALDEQFGSDRKERMLDATSGMGPGRRGKDGRHYHQDRHSGDWEPMSNEEVERTYLSGPVVDET